MIRDDRAPSWKMARLAVLAIVVASAVGLTNPPTADTSGSSQTTKAAPSTETANREPEKLETSFQAEGRPKPDGEQPAPKRQDTVVGKLLNQLDTLRPKGGADESASRMWR